MARVLQISDGTLTVDLLNSSGLNIKIDGWLPVDPGQKQIRRDNIFSEGIGLVHSVAENLIEQFKIKLSGASHDAIATSLQNLATLQKQAREFHTTTSQKTPVYLKSQTSGETNARFALIYDIRVKFGKGIYDTIFETAKVVNEITVTIEREPYWRSHAPGSTAHSYLTIESASEPSNRPASSTQYIGNHKDSVTGLTHVYNYDDSLTAFSANLVAASLPYDYFRVSGSTPAANDAVYWGSTAGSFTQLIFYIGTAAVWSGVTIVWEYWNGSAWTNGVADGYIRVGNGDFLITGESFVSIIIASGVAKTTINGVSAYWIRARISAISGFTTAPTQATQDVFCGRSSHITIPSTEIDGDMDALCRIRFDANPLNNLSGVDEYIYWIMLSVRTHDVTNFYSRINLGTQGNSSVPAIDVTFGSDTSAQENNLGPGGRVGLCTFAGTLSLVDRCLIGLGGANWFRGRFAAFLRCQQIGGSVGDVSVALRLGYAGAAYTQQLDTVKLKTRDEGIELVYLGDIEIGRMSGISGNYEDNVINQSLNVMASAVSATPDLRFYDLVLMPIDEYAAVIASTDLRLASNVKLIQSVGKQLDIDSGLIKEAAFHLANSGSSLWGIGEWEMRGKPLKLKPDTEIQLHVLFGSLITSDLALKSPHSVGGTIRILTHERWSLMRGAE